MGERTLTCSRASKQRKLIRVVVYLRVSTMQQVVGYGLRVQEAQCRAWLDYRLGKGSYTIIRVFSDDGVSGKLASRPDFDRMNALIAGKGADLVVVGKLDRVGRTVKDIHRWAYDTTELGVRIATADGRIDSQDEMFEITLSVLAHVAQLEHTLILERTAAGREQKIAAGGWPLGQPPYGVVLEGTGKNAVPVLSAYECEVLDLTCRFIAEEGLNRHEAAEKLNLLGYKTRNGKPWTGDNLAGRLRTTALDGYAEFKIMRPGEDDEEDDTFEVFRIPVPRPLAEERVAALRTAMAARTFTKKNQRAYLLTGRFTAFCGGHYTGGKAPDRDAAYRCMGKRLGLFCTCSELPALETEHAVWREVEKLLTDTTRFRGLIEAEMGAVPGRIASYERRLAQIDAELDKQTGNKKERLLELLAQVSDDDDRDVDLETLAEVMAALWEKSQERIKALREERERVADWRAEARDHVARAKAILAKVEGAAPTLEGFDSEQKGDLLSLLDVRVQVIGQGEARRKGIADPLTEWHRSTGRLVPAAIDDEQWDRVAAILKPSRQNVDGAREVFAAILHKLRTAERWNEVLAPTGAWNGVYRRARAWHADGSWEAALDALGAYEGTPVPDPFLLPPMLVTGAIDPKCASVEQEESGERTWSSA
ncbi:recombinase family protein [Streptacidiphilus griseoplanus]|uniref:recombinase family protein n=1 Tax=Peterkaempfera griseoplana TaxID=66896 RepID=UPI0006E22206|nr:recombinase family protein [Peterkaempfera griseoplana]